METPLRLRSSTSCALPSGEEVADPVLGIGIALIALNQFEIETMVG
jgi:hypothetical protein